MAALAGDFLRGFRGASAPRIAFGAVAQHGCTDGTGRHPSRRLAWLAPAVLLGLAGPALAIVGGREAGASDLARSSVMVLTATGGVCTGLVVARDAVLTAGHCVAGIRANRIRFLDAAGAPILMETRARAVHPAYDPDPVSGRTRSIDLALLRTRVPLPGRLPLARLSTAMPAPGAILSFGGFGAARAGDARSLGRFRVADLPVVAPLGPSGALIWLHAPGRGGCNGDSGGPIASEDGTLALAAWVKDACGGVTQAILLGPQRAWIDHTLAGWGAAARWGP